MEFILQKNIYLGNNISDFHKERLDIDILLKYFNHRIKSIYNSDEKEILLKEITMLKAAFFKEEFSVFREKINEINEFIKSKSTHQNATKLLGIYNLIGGIKQRFNKRVAMLTKNFGRHVPEICSHHATIIRPRPSCVRRALIPNGNHARVSHNDLTA